MAHQAAPAGFLYHDPFAIGQCDQGRIPRAGLDREDVLERDQFFKTRRSTSRRWVSYTTTSPRQKNRYHAFCFRNFNSYISAMAS